MNENEVNKEARSARKADSAREESLDKESDARGKGQAGVPTVANEGLGISTTRQPRLHNDPPQSPDVATNREFYRPENEDDDGYDPYSDRRPAAEPLFERDPWA